ncbi:hypothetical protein MKW92_042939 [Papaver armeniacum]|nr:hypothetical protein MKW92_042939 [Papaver armeniacum]
MELARERAKGKEVAREPLNLVLFGRVGNGKSSLGNNIIRKTEVRNGKVVDVKVFEAKAAASGVTIECKMQTTTLEGGQVVNVIDTPGIFDTAISKENLRQEIVKCMHLTKDGIHGFLLVFSIRTRFSEEEKCAIKYLQEFFGDKIVDYMIVVFTGGDELEEDMTLDDYWGQACPQALKEVMNMCNNRVVVFDNKTKDEKVRTEQVNRLMPQVDMVLAKNNGKPFTNEIFEEIQRQARLRPANEQHSLNMHKLYEMQINKINESIARRLDEVTQRFQEELERERAKGRELTDANQKLQQALDDQQEQSSGGGCSIL